MSNRSPNTVVGASFLKDKLTVADQNDSAIVLTTKDHVATYFQTRKMPRVNQMSSQTTQQNESGGYDTSCFITLAIFQWS